MYKLFNRVPDGTKTMLSHIKDYLSNQGKDIVTEDENAPKNPVQFVTVSSHHTLSAENDCSTLAVLYTHLLCSPYLRLRTIMISSSKNLLLWTGASKQ